MPAVLPERTARFPFPFPDDTYRYSTNVEPARRPVVTAAGTWGDRLLHVDDGYAAELALRRTVLAADPMRCQQLPHMRVAAWDALLTLLPDLAATYPDAMALRRHGDRWSWRNDLIGTSASFVVGDDDSLPGGPLAFLGSQVQEDVVLLDQREGSLWADAGLVTSAADWSMGFDVGMRFLEVHGPVPRVHEAGVVQRAEQFLMRLQPGQEYRRTNWTMTVDRRLDTSTETYPEWGRDRRLVVADPALPDRLHLRVEVQHLVRLGASNAICFLIRTYLLSLRDLAAVPEWRSRFAAVLAELPDDMADYKGLTRFRAAAVDWLRTG
ncbi:MULTISPECIES: heme-dependent oxidative N-demethylase family protein [unclassified Geodermatophilus]|uniref:heme-dependent oxidative N-demethylase family protein n=1 Tax=unclassified Geodermatophilus TaxID=2637632 RepID=UPI003EE97AFD